MWSHTFQHGSTKNQGRRCNYCKTTCKNEYSSVVPIQINVDHLDPRLLPHFCVQYILWTPVFFYYITSLIEEVTLLVLIKFVEPIITILYNIYQISTNWETPMQHDLAGQLSPTAPGGGGIHCLLLQQVKNSLHFYILAFSVHNIISAL
jgi:hypothetical protein